MFKYDCCWGVLGGPMNYCAVCPQEQRQVQVLPADGWSGEQAGWPV